MANFKPRAFRRLIILVLIILVLYALVPKIGDFQSSLQAMKSANISWLILGLAATILTYLMAAGQYYFLALKPLKFLRTFAVQCASAFANRLLPAGLGGISLSVAYLKKQRHSNTEAGVVVGANDLLGVVANVIIVAVIVGTGAQLSLAIEIPTWIFIIAAVVILMILVAALVFKKLRQKSRQVLSSVVKDITSYWSHPLRVTGSLICAVLLSIFYATALYFSMKAIGFSLPAGQVFLIYVGSVIVATATPTPGGLVGAEAAITAGFVAYGLSAADSLAIALIYRLITYWLPLIIGVGFFAAIRRRKYI